MRGKTQTVSRHPPSLDHTHRPLGFLKSETTESLRIHLDNGKAVEGSFLVRNWWCIHNANKGAIRAPYNFNPDGSKNWNATHLFHITVDVPTPAAGHHLTSITFPEYADWNNLHVFALTLDTVSTATTWTDKDKIDVRSVRGTRRWKEVNGQRGQVVEVTLSSPLSASLHLKQDAWIMDRLEVSIDAPGVKVLEIGTLNRFMPGDEQTLEVVIESEIAVSGHRQASVHFKGSTSWKKAVQVEGSALGVDLDKWTGEVADLEQHTTPSWFNGAKFGVSLPSFLGAGSHSSRSSSTGACMLSPPLGRQNNMLNGMIGGYMTTQLEVPVRPPHAS